MQQQRQQHGEAERQPKDAGRCALRIVVAPEEQARQQGDEQAQPRGPRLQVLCVGEEDSGWVAG